MRQSGALLGFFPRMSTNERGIAGHDRLALSVRSRSSCSIAAIRRLKSEDSEFFGHCVDWHAVTVDRTRALVTRLKSRGRLNPKQIVVAAMRKLLVLCFGVLKTGKPFDPALAMGC